MISWMVRVARDEGVTCMVVGEVREVRIREGG